MRQKKTTPLYYFLLYNHKAAHLWDWASVQWRQGADVLPVTAILSVWAPNATLALFKAKRIGITSHRGMRASNAVHSCNSLETRLLQQINIFKNDILCCQSSRAQDSFFCGLIKDKSAIDQNINKTGSWFFGWNSVSGNTKNTVRVRVSVCVYVDAQACSQ